MHITRKDWGRLATAIDKWNDKYESFSHDRSSDAFGMLGHAYFTQAFFDTWRSWLRFYRSVKDGAMALDKVQMYDSHLYTTRLKDFAVLSLSVDTLARRIDPNNPQTKRLINRWLNVVQTFLQEYPIVKKITGIVSKEGAGDLRGGFHILYNMMSLSPTQSWPQMNQVLKDYTQSDTEQATRAQSSSDQTHPEKHASDTKAERLVRQVFTDPVSGELAPAYCIYKKHADELYRLYKTNLDEVEAAAEKILGDKKNDRLLTLSHWPDKSMWFEIRSGLLLDLAQQDASDTD